MQLGHRLAQAKFTDAHIAYLGHINQGNGFCNTTSESV